MSESHANKYVLVKSLANKATCKRHTWARFLGFPGQNENWLIDTPAVIIKKQGENWSNPAVPSLFGEADPCTTPLPQGPQGPWSPRSAPGQHEIPPAPLLPLLPFESSRIPCTSLFVHFYCFASAAGELGA